MKIGIIGRSELTYNAMLLAKNRGHDIVFIVTSKEASEYKISSEDFKNFATENNIPFIHDPKISASKLINIVNTTFPEICISVNYSGVISTDVIDLFPYGILNAHGGDLPRYRGNACQAWAIINGEKRMGLCIHKMIGGELDSGDIIARSYKEIGINTRIGELYEWMLDEVPDLLIEGINKISENSEYILETQSQEKNKALRCYPRKPEDGKINWNHSSINILRLINASSEPFSGAYCEYENTKFIIWRAELYNDEEVYCGIPGQVSNINQNENFLIIITGKGKIKVTEVEFNGMRTTPNKIIKSIRKRLK